MRLRQFLKVELYSDTMCAGIWVCRSVGIINPNASFFFLTERNINRETCIQTGKYGSPVNNGGTEDTILVGVPCSQ